MNTKKNAFYIGIAVVIFAILCLAGIRIYLSISASQNEALREYALSNGPWAEQSAWITDDQQAYLLSRNKSGEQFAAVTAYFCLDGAWHSFRVNMTYGNTLTFSDTETPTEQFNCDFTIKDATLTRSNLKLTEDGSVMPTKDSYVFAKAEDYDEVISQLPFNTDSDILQVGIDKIFLNINRADFLQDRTLEILRDNSCHVLVKRYGVRLVILAAYLQNEPRIIHKRHKIIPPLFLPLLASSRRALSKWCIF